MNIISLPLLPILAQEMLNQAFQDQTVQALPALVSSGELLVILLIGGAFLVALVGIVLGIRHSRFEREIEHAERMKALELGMTLPKDAPWWTPTRVAVAIGAAVPLGCFLLALAASESSPANQLAWPAACGVGVVSVICGTILALRLRAQSPPDVDLPRKPYLSVDDRDFSS